MKKILLIAALLFTSFMAQAQLIHEGTSYHYFLEIRNNRADNAYAQGTVRSLSTDGLSNQTVVVNSLACPNCFSNAEVNNNTLRINADALGKNFFHPTSIIYEKMVWAPNTVVSGLVFNTIGTTRLIETANTQLPGITGARMRALVYTATATYTSPWVALKANSRNVIPVNPGIANPTKVILDFYNVNSLWTQYSVETLNLEVNPPNCQ